MALFRSLPENATLTDLRQTYADLLEKLHPYGHRLMRGPSPLTPGQRELIAAFVFASTVQKPPMAARPADRGHLPQQ
jgi:alkylhydroperoxidase/carboxymuconolactone decarboxylase family protein YurZ